MIVSKYLFRSATREIDFLFVFYIFKWITVYKRRLVFGAFIGCCAIATGMSNWRFMIIVGLFIWNDAQKREKNDFSWFRRSAFWIRAFKELLAKYLICQWIGAEWCEALESPFLETRECLPSFSTWELSLQVVKGLDFKLFLENVLEGVLGSR